MLGPLTAFEPLVPEGRYLLDDDRAQLAVYFVDVRFYRATMNNTVRALEEQHAIAESLATRIRDGYPDVRRGRIVTEEGSG